MVVKSAFTLRSTGSLLVLAIMLCAASGAVSVANAQTPMVAARLLFPPRNYEIALGDTVQPVVRIRNTDSVAHTAIRIEYRIRNVMTLIVVYDDSITVPSLAAGDSIDLNLAPYVTNANILSQLGTFDGCLIAADTTCARLFGLRRTSTPFRDPSNNYSKSIVDQRSTTKVDAPDQYMWVSIGATVVEGDDSTWDPPPPRDLNEGGYGPDTMHSPVIRLDRKDLAGNFYSGFGVGDTLTSFPINLNRQMYMDLTFDFTRGGRYRYPLGWDSKAMPGPERSLTDEAGKLIRAGDSLVIEFKKPSAPGTNPLPESWDEIAAIDGGHDLEYSSFMAFGDTCSWWIKADGIIRTITNTPNYLDSNFRFRFRLKAKNDAPPSTSATDDGDPWYIDNVLLKRPNYPQLELLWVRVVNPYTKVPRSQAQFPVFLNVHNYNYGNFGVFDVPPIHVAILNPLGDTVYSQRVIIPFLNADTLIQFPDWDASGEWSHDSQAYMVTAAIEGAVDSYEDDNQTFTKFFLNVESGDQAVQELAFDDAGITPAMGAGNDIPKLTGIPGAGIGFKDTTGSFAMKFQLAQKDILYGVRLYFGDANQSPDHIRISLLNGNSNSCTPGDTVAQPGVASTFTDVRRGGYFNQFWPYFFPKPMVLAKGIYWIAVSQLRKNSMELGGDISRGGGELVCASNVAPRINAIYGPTSQGAPWYGTQYGSGPADNNGDVSCSFAFETPAGSGNWQPMMPREGLWPVMATGSQLQPKTAANMTTPITGAGTYLPMIRPVLTSAVITPRGVTADTSATSSLALSSLYPNPFDPSTTSTTIAFTLPTSSPVLLTVCNIMGDVLKTLVKSELPAGPHAALWDGKDDLGAIVPGGTYLVSLSAAGQRATAKMIVLE